MTRRLAVQMLLPTESASLWDVGKWDEAVWSIETWWDITEYVHGAEWERGALEFDGRPDVGEAEITLKDDGGMFSPLDPSASYNGLVGVNGDGEIINYYFGVGAIIRIVELDPDDPDDVTGWAPQFTGIVSSWTERHHAAHRVKFIDIVLTETLAALATVDEVALTNVVGNNDTVMQRVRRLADAANWRFGYIDATEAAYDTYLLQSTDMATNRLGELYLTGASVGATVRSDRSGSIIVHGPGAPLVGPATELKLASLPDPGDAVRLDPEDLKVANDNEAVKNVAQLGRSGSTVQTAIDSVSVGRFKARYTFGPITNLVNKSDELTLQLAQDIVDARGQLVDRVQSVVVSSLLGGAAFLATADVQSVIDSVELIAEDGEHKLVFENVRIDHMHHKITPVDGRWVWTARYTLGRSLPPRLEPLE